MVMEKTAVLSDIHGNLDALERVLARIDDLGIKRIICLGDTIGYGPEPVECLRLARARFDVILMGNHEFAAASPDEYAFNDLAARALSWTRDQLIMASELDGLQDLPVSHKEDDTLFVHGSMRDPLVDYVTETDIDGYSRFGDIARELEEDFTVTRLCFVGHNHKAFLATEEGFIYPHDGRMDFQVTGEKLYACVGSAGQPRDGDHRACFAVFDGDKIQYVRVPYPVENVAKKIFDSSLPNELGTRLLEGM